MGRGVNAPHILGDVATKYAGLEVWSRMPSVVYQATRKNRKFMYSKKVKIEMQKTMSGKVQKACVVHFKKRTTGWDHKVAFTGKRHDSIDMIRLWMHAYGKNADIWKFVSGGTKRHDIPVKNAATLAFLWGGKGSYKAKTGTGDQYGRAASVSGGTWRFPLIVDHPGNEAREFEKYIAIDFKPDFSRIMNNAFRIIIRTL